MSAQSIFNPMLMKMLAQTYMVTSGPGPGRHTCKSQISCVLLLFCYKQINQSMVVILNDTEEDHGICLHALRPAFVYFDILFNIYIYKYGAYISGNDVKTVFAKSAKNGLHRLAADNVSLIMTFEFNVRTKHSSYSRVRWNSGDHSTR